MLKISYASNGFILRDTDDKTIEVFNTDTNELDAVHTLLWTIQSKLGYAGSKHDHYRIKISVENQRENDE